MAGRLTQPGVEVYQIADERKPSVFRPVLVPLIFGVHTNIQKNLELVFHADGTTNSDAVIPTGLPEVTQQIMNSGDIRIYLETARGLAPLTVTTHYTLSLDSSLGVDNLVTIKDPLSLTKTLVDDVQSDVITLQASGGTNYVVISDSDIDYSLAGVQPGDKVTIDWTTSVKNSSASFTGQSLVVTEVLDSSHVKAVWSNNNSLWVDERGVSYTIKTDTMSDQSGQVFISYDNARVISGVNNIIEIGSTEDAREHFGALEPANALGYHVLMALNSTDKTFYAMRVATDDVAGYESALEAAKADEDIYIVVPTTDSSTIHGLCQSHVDYMSQPENKGERVTFVSQTIPEYDKKVDKNDEITWTSTTSATTVLTLSTSWNSYLTNIVPGDIWRPTNTTVLSGGSVVNNDSVRLTVISIAGNAVTLAGQMVSTGAVTTTGSAVTGYFTTTNYTRDRKAKYVSAIGEAYDNKRVIHVYPDTVYANVSSISQDAPTYELTSVTAETSSPGSVACAILAAWASAAGPATPMSNEIVPGLTDLDGSNDTLTKDHLDTIAGGGNWILIRTRGGSLVTTRHQLTTAVSDVNTREFSVVKAVDFASKTFREYLKPLVGKSVITDTFIAKVVRPVSHAALHALVELGAISSKSSVLSIVQDTTDPTRIIIEVDIVPLYPANYFTVKIYV